MKLRNIISIIILLPNFAFASVCSDFIQKAKGSFTDPKHINILNVDHSDGTFMHVIGNNHAAYAPVLISCQGNQISFSWDKDSGEHRHPFKGTFNGTLHYHDGDRPRKRIYGIYNIRLTINDINSYIYAMIFDEN